MAKTAKDYPVMFKYGYSAAYGGWHTGEDRPAPYGTPVVVNGVQIGLSGNTGYVLPAPTPQNPKAGAHLHVGKWRGGTSYDPAGGGFNFRDAVVTEVGQDGRNGKFVRVQGDGYSWVYLHLSRQDGKVGQRLKVKAPLPIPVLRAFYTVKAGDTATAISKKYGISLATFKALNPGIKDINWIYVNQKVRVK